MKQKSKKTNPPQEKHLVDADSGSTESGEKKSLQTVETGNGALTAHAKTVAIFKSILAQATGVKDPGVATLIIDSLTRLQVPHNSAVTAVQRLDFAVSTMHEISPKTIMEAFLAAQMVAVHHASLAAIEKATSPYGTDERQATSIASATSLMRLFVEQLDAMAKLKGKTGQQKVTVEHVHVHDGGQAIVGAVNSGRSSHGEGGKGEKRTKTP